MDVSLSKLPEIRKDRQAWMRSQRVGHENWTNNYNLMFVYNHLFRKISHREIKRRELVSLLYIVSCPLTLCLAQYMCFCIYQINGSTCKSGKKYRCGSVLLLQESSNINFRNWGMGVVERGNNPILKDHGCYAEKLKTIQKVQWLTQSVELTVLWWKTVDHQFYYSKFLVKWAFFNSMTEQCRNFSW